MRPGTVLRDHIGVERARRLAEPGSPDSANTWLDARANNHGFYSPVDYPWRPATGERTAIVGLFGGSVTQFMSLQVGHELACEIEAAGVWPSDRVAVLNFAASGMEQPQNLAALTWFLAVGQTARRGRADRRVRRGGALVPQRAARLPTRCTEHHALAAGRCGRQPLRARRKPGSRRRVSRSPSTSSTRGSARHAQFHLVCRAAEIPLVHLLQPNQYDGSRGSAPVEQGRATMPRLAVPARRRGRLSAPAEGGEGADAGWRARGRCDGPVRSRSPKPCTPTPAATTTCAAAVALKDCVVENLVRVLSGR